MAGRTGEENMNAGGTRPSHPAPCNSSMHPKWPYVTATDILATPRQSKGCKGRWGAEAGGGLTDALFPHPVCHGCSMRLTLRLGELDAGAVHRQPFTSMALDGEEEAGREGMSQGGGGADAAPLSVW